jgi:hypothetical protein
MPGKYRYAEELSPLKIAENENSTIVGTKDGTIPEEF